jgi:hypothetical protein
VDLNERSPVHEKNGNTVPLREYIEALIAERDKAVKEAMRQMEIRLAGLNELRRSVEEDRGLLLTKEKFDAETAVLESRLNVIERDEAWVGRGGSLASLADIKRRIEALENWRGKAALVVGAGVFLGGIVGAAVMRLFMGAFGI